MDKAVEYSGINTLTIYCVSVYFGITYTFDVIFLTTRFITELEKSRSGMS